jgi:hypothetical protein
VVLRESRIETSIQTGVLNYQWTESIAVGDKEFVMQTKAILGAKAIGRKGMKDMSLRNPKVLTTVFLTLKSAV